MDSINENIICKYCCHQLGPSLACNPVHDCDAYSLAYISMRKSYTFLLKLLFKVLSSTV